MYKIRILITAIILINIIAVNFKSVLANQTEEELTQAEVIDEINAVNASAELKDEPNLNSRAAIIYNRDSKEVMWGKNQNVRRKMASTTKVVYT